MECGLLCVRLTPIATKLCVAAQFRDVPQADNGGCPSNDDIVRAEQPMGRRLEWTIARISFGGHMERTACCHCGSLRATVSGEPTVVNVCHCKACQRRTGAIMHSGVYFNKSQVRVDGPEKMYTRQVEGVSRTISFHFCPTCSSSVYWHLDLRPDHYGIAVGAFADPGFPPPTLSIWEQSRHSWINLPEGMQHFPKARV